MGVWNKTTSFQVAGIIPVPYIVRATVPQHSTVFIHRSVNVYTVKFATHRISLFKYGPQLQMIPFGWMIVAVLAVAVVGAPTAVATDDTPDSVQRVAVNFMCKVYVDHIDENVSIMEIFLGSSLGISKLECEITTEHAETHRANQWFVAITEGALYPECEITKDCFEPYFIRIQAGEEVTWINQDTVLHTVTHTAPDSNVLFDQWTHPSEEFTFKFDTPGTYKYTCTVHPWAAGVVVVDSEEFAHVTKPAADPTNIPQDPRDSLAFEVVDSAIKLYDDRGEEAFDIITATWASQDQAVVTYVASKETGKIVAHSENPTRIGLDIRPTFDKAYLPAETMLDTIDIYPEGVWLSYPVSDSQGNIISYDRGWFKGHDGYYFAALYRIDSEDRVRSVVGEMIRVYDSDSEGTFDNINTFMSNDPNYPIVLDKEWNVVAHGANPDLMGVNLRESAERSLPISIMLEELEIHTEGIWGSYPVWDPLTGEPISYMRGWFQMHDGYVFVSSYDIEQAERVKGVVSDTIRMYDTDRARGFERITSFMSTDPNYPFVLHPTDDTVVAHGSNPDRIGATSRSLTDADKPKAVTLAELQEGTGTWVVYIFNNPVTGMEEYKRSWLVMHDGYIFGSGYYSSVPFASSDAS